MTEQDVGDMWLYSIKYWHQTLRQGFVVPGGRHDPYL
jgi:hypothetical protein